MSAQPSARPSVIQMTEARYASNDLFRPLREASPLKPYVIAQLGQSLDGRIATVSGQSRWINGDAALDHLHRLRSHVDAVVVGAGTVVADDPLLTVRRVPGRQPARVVIDPTGRISRNAHCFADDGTARFLISEEGRTPAGAVTALPIARGADGLMPPAAILEALFARGLRRVLVEGGATTVSAFLNAKAVDRLHVLVAPIILGSGINGLSLAPISGLNEAMRPATTVHVLDDGDVLFDCDLSSLK
jgi:riboflavin-specific deaminase-like protein